MVTTSTDDNGAANATEMTTERFKMILRDADTHQPKPGTLKALDELFKESPKLWQATGDMMARAASAAVKASGGTALAQASMHEGMATMRRDLGYDDAPLLERLLIDQVVLCWLRMSTAEFLYSQRIQGQMQIDHAQYFERRLTATQMRYLRAIEMLTRIRRLAALRPLQINIGGQQVNIAGTLSERQQAHLLERESV